MIKSLAVRVGDDRVAVSRHDRRDVLEHYPEADAHCGFEVYVPCRPCIPAYFEVETETGVEAVRIEFPQKKLAVQPETTPYIDFVNLVNGGRLAVLEVGSRIVGSTSIDQRRIFHAAKRFIGVDIHPSPIVDIVGDVHQLSQLIEPGSVDAIFSVSVLEHLEMPWVVTAEMNRVLPIGGYVFHSTLQSWPLHEQPNDFWRFSEEGLKVLFGSHFGFEVITATMNCPMAIYPEYRADAFLQVPLIPGYAESCILSRKISEVPNQVLPQRERARLYPNIGAIGGEGKLREGPAP